MCSCFLGSSRKALVVGTVFFLTAQENIKPNSRAKHDDRFV